MSKPNWLGKIKKNKPKKENEDKKNYLKRLVKELLKKDIPEEWFEWR